MPSSNPKHSRRGTGTAFEKKAAEFYQSQGFTILEQSWQAGHLEIDLIVKKGSLIVFVEVKSSRTKSFGHPVERVDKTKVRRLSAAAQQYVIEKKIEGADLRFDVVTFSNGALEQYPSAFEFSE